jgi:hypothetical protein
MSKFEPEKITQQYHSFLVRLWQDSPGAPWRASAKNVLTGEERRFATMESLFVFLQSEAAVSATNDSKNLWH